MEVISRVILIAELNILAETKFLSQGINLEN